MMGEWQDVRGPSGRLLCRIDAERRLLEIARNGERAVVDLDVWLVDVESVPASPALDAAHALVREGLAGLGVDIDAPCEVS